MQKSVRDIWTTLVQLRKCNTSHASKWKESIALSVFRGSKVPCQLCVSGWAVRLAELESCCRSLSPLCLAAHQRLWAPATSITRWFHQLWLSICAARQLRMATLQRWCRTRHRKSQKPPLSVKAWLSNLAISLFAAHIQLSKILWFKPSFS